MKSTYITTENGPLPTLVHEGTSYDAKIEDEEKKSLAVIQEPEDNAKLRMTSYAVSNEKIPIIAQFMQEYLLPTMYYENGIGIAAIQVGLPVSAFIVDIPVVELKNENGTFVTCALGVIQQKLKVSETVCIKTVTPNFKDGERKFDEKVEKQIPQLNSSGEFCGIQTEVVTSDIMIDALVTHQPMFCINPKITFSSEEQVTMAEGCLSVPAELVKEKYGNNTYVKRPISITLEFTNASSQREEMQIDGTKDDHNKWLSRCSQHEYDHTKGILFIDYLVEEVSLAGEELELLNESMQALST